MKLWIKIEKEDGAEPRARYPRDVMDLRDFRRTCYTAAQSTGGKVVEVRPAEHQTPNFHLGLIAYRDHQVGIACSRDAAVLAVAEPQTIDPVYYARESSTPKYVDAPELVAMLKEQLPKFQVLSQSDLTGPFDAAAWPHIWASDIAYWRPANLGEALFNYWD